MKKITLAIIFALISKVSFASDKNLLAKYVKVPKNISLSDHKINTVYFYEDGELIQEVCYLLNSRECSDVRTTLSKEHLKRLKTLIPIVSEQRRSLDLTEINSSGVSCLAISNSNATVTLGPYFDYPYSIISYTSEPCGDGFVIDTKEAEELLEIIGSYI